MIVYEFTPYKNVRAVVPVTAILVATACCAMLIPACFPAIPAPWMYQLIAIACVGCAIYLLLRHFAKSYIYRIVQDEDSERLTFTVTEVSNQGTKRITVCRLALKHVDQVCTIHLPQDSEKNSQARRVARREGRSFFDFCPNISQKHFCYVFATESGVSLLIRLDLDPTLVRYLSEGGGKNSEENDS